MSEQTDIATATPDAPPLDTSLETSMSEETETVENDASDGNWDMLDPTVTPLPPAPEKEGAEKIEAKVEAKPEEAKAPEQEAAKPEEAKAEPAKAGAKAEGEAEDKKGKLLFEDHYLNPANDMGKTRDYLEGRSPSRYAELELSMLNKRLEQPLELAQALFQNDPEAYGKLAMAVYEGAPDYFLTKATGRETTLDAVNKALDFHARYGDQVDALAAGDMEFSEEEIAEVRPFFAEKALKMEAINERLKEAKANAPAPKPAEAQPEAQPQGFTPAQEKILDGAEVVSQTYFDKKVNIEFGLAVTDAEKASAPVVAKLKSEKAKYMREGFGLGVTERFKDDPKFVAVVTEISHWSLKEEAENANAAAAKLQPFIDAYANERSQSEDAKFYDEWLSLATQFPNLSPVQMGEILSAHKKSQPKPATRVPGSPSTSSSRPAPTSEMDALDQMLEDDAMARAGR